MFVWITQFTEGGSITSLSSRESAFVLPSAVSSWGAKVGHDEVPAEIVAVLSSSTGSEEAEDGISNAPECTRRPVLFWKETAVGEGTEEIDVEVSRVVAGIVWVEESSRVAAAAAAGSGDVAESRTLSVAV